MAKKDKKIRIYKDQAKDRHTTHWDMDYLTFKEVEALYSKPKKTPGKREPDVKGDPARIGWILIIMGAALLVLSLILIRFLV
jgi:hypothetical protein